MTRRRDAVISFVVIAEETLRQIAKIVGPSAAAHQALADIEKRRADGQDPICIGTRGVYFVVDSRAITEKASR